MSDFKMAWYGDQVLNASKIVVKNVSKEVAKDVMEDAKSILKRKAKTTTDRGLLSQFSVEKVNIKQVDIPPIVKALEIGIHPTMQVLLKWERLRMNQNRL